MGRYEVKNPLTPEGRNQINSMFEELYKEYIGAGNNAKEAREKAVQAVADSILAKDIAETTRQEMLAIIREQTKNGDLAPEIAQARGKAKTLGERFNSVDSQLAQLPTQGEIYNLIGRISEGTPLFADSVGDMSDASRVYVNKSDGYVYTYDGESFKSTNVLYQSTGLSDNAVTYRKQSVVRNKRSVNLFDGYYRPSWVSGDTGVYSPVYAGVTSVFLELENNGIYQINTEGAHDRMIVGLVNDVNVSGTAKIVYSDYYTQGNENIIIKNTDYKYAVISLSSQGQKPRININKLNKDLGFNFEYTKNLSDVDGKEFWVDIESDEVLVTGYKRSYVVHIQPNTNITIKTHGNHSKFTVYTANQVKYKEIANKIYLKNGDGNSTGNETFNFYNANANYMIIGLNDNQNNQLPNIDVSVVLEDFYNAGSYKLNEEKNKILDALKLETKKLTLKTFFETFINKKSASEYTLIQSSSKTFETQIKPYAKYKVKLIGSDNTNFRVATFKKIVSSSIFGETIENVLVDNNNAKEFEFINDGESVDLLVCLGSDKQIAANVEIYETDGISSDLVLKYPKRMSERLIDFDSGITQTSEIYPVMCAVKMTNENDLSTGIPESPRPVGWLYYHPITYEFYYAKGSPENMRYLFTWDRDLTWNGASLPYQYRAFITKDGDVIFVWRGDLAGSSYVRQNPIVYPANNWMNPVEVKLTGVKPTAWLQNCGAEFIYNEDVFLFAEYTRPAHINAHVWKVTKPFTNPNNWTITRTEVLSGSNIDGLKHFHTMNYDPYSGKVFTTTGDDDLASKILMSGDFGDSWEVVLDNSRKYCRLLNFIFTKDKIYWASDDYQHYLFEASRDVNGVPDFTDVRELANLTGHPPTYVTALIDKPYGLLLLDRNDGVQDRPLKIHFWSIADDELIEVGEVSPVDGIATTYGFRNEAVNFYQSKGDNRIVVGFAEPPNDIDILNNVKGDLKNRINNVVIQLEEDFKLKFSAINDRS